MTGCKKDEPYMSSSSCTGFLHSELLKMIQEQMLELSFFMLSGQLGEFVTYTYPFKSWQSNFALSGSWFLGRVILLCKISD